MKSAIAPTNAMINIIIIAIAAGGNPLLQSNFLTTSINDSVLLPYVQLKKEKNQH